MKPAIPVFQVLCLSAVLCSSGISAEHAPRTWTRDDGRAVTATWVKTEDGQVHLRLPNGREFALQRERLSEADHRYLEERETESGEGAENGDAVPEPETVVPEVDPRAIERGEPVVFAGLRLNTVLSPHFRVFTKGVDGTKAAENAEILWRRMALVHPTFLERFAAGADAPRTGVILVDRKGDWEELLSWYSTAMRNAGNVRLANEAEATWPHTAGQQLLIDADSMSKLGIRKFVAAINCAKLRDKNEVECAFRTHSLAALLMRQLLGERLGEIPLWLSHGMGYYHEIRLCGRTSTHLVDYEAYAAGTGADGNVRFAKRFQEGDRWPGLVAEMAKDGEPPPALHRVLAAEVGTLSPELCGYVFGFADFLHSSPESTRAFAAFLERPGLASVVRAPETLASAMGFDSVKALETAWSDYLKSKEFRR
ncbi:MAG TPA: hypothetical protein VMN36_17315 [Verrucomicrobiales bacterium]|nr:hypothetical protein [Verrucomicrobiales bacterium]